MNMQRFMAIVKKEFIQIKRDKASFIIALVIPLMMMLLFGYVVTTELDHIPMVVLDQSHSTESRNLIESFENTLYFNVTGEVNNMDTVNQRLNKGLVHAALVIPPNYETNLEKGQKPKVLLMIDGSDPTTARTAYSNGVLSGEKFGIKVTQDLNAKYNQQGSTGGIEVDTKVLYNPELKSQNFTIPGLVGLIMQNITILLTAFTLVRERERGTIEQLIVSPVKPVELILGKLFPYIVIGFFDFIYALAFGMYWFNVPMKGSLPLLILLGSGFVICALAIGVLISTLAKTQLQAMQFAILALLPSVLLSGFVFPREAMPKIVQWIGYIIPLTYFLNIIRGIVLKGVGIEYLLNDIIFLFALGLLLLTLSIFRFRKKLD